MPAPGGAPIDAEGMKVFAKQLRSVDRNLGKGLAAELRSIGNEVRDKVRSSTGPPYGPTDSKGKIGRKRKSVKTSVRLSGHGGVVSLYSLEPDAGVWHWGGTIKPRGVPITIPRTEFVSAEVEHASQHVEEDLAGLLDGLAMRYAQFT